MSGPLPRPWARALVGICGGLALSLLGCGSEEDDCAGPQIDPFPAALDFGDLVFEGESGPSARRVVLLRNTCGGVLTLNEVCVVDDAHNGDPEAPAFELEPADRTSIPAGEVGAVRVTYTPPTINEDLDEDGVPDPNQALLVVQSNARDRPTLVVPLCGRAIAAADPPADPAPAQPCGEAFTIPPGERVADLCQR